VTIPVRLCPEAQEDLSRLPSAVLRRVALGWLQRVGRRPTLGTSLRYQRGIGCVPDWRKLYFDEGDKPWNPARRPRLKVGEMSRFPFRIVYRIRPSEEHPGFIEVISIGSGRP
jgi:hypothetical protein